MCRHSGGPVSKRCGRRPVLAHSASQQCHQMLCAVVCVRPQLSDLTLVGLGVDADADADADADDDDDDDDDDEDEDRFDAGAARAAFATSSGAAAAAAAPMASGMSASATHKPSSATAVTTALLHHRPAAQRPATVQPLPPPAL